MSFISVFDVIGPNMVGPSSSHTAGACAIAYLAQKMNSGVLKKVDFTLYGSFAKTGHGHGTDRALLGGIMGFATDDVRIRDSFAIARREGIDFSFTTDDQETEVHPNTVDIRMENEDGRVMTVRGESLGGGKVRIVRINQVQVDFTGEYNAVIIIQKDRPGVAAHITRCLGDHQVNIAFMRIFRESKGETAYTIVESDERLPDDITEKLMINPHVRDVMLIQKAMPVQDDPAGVGADNKGHDPIMTDYKNAEELLALCDREKKPISYIMRQRECQLGEVSEEQVQRRMTKALAIMRESALTPLTTSLKSMGGLIGGQAKMLDSHRGKGENICGDILGRGITYAMAVLEVNASMGVIVAAPTAGSSGIVPGLLLSLQESCALSDEQMTDALFNAGAIGYLAMRNATVAGAVGGCQAEVGVAAAMAASACVEVMGGSPRQSLDAASTVLINMLGLVCDPVGGLVEYPCQNRNAAGVANALAAAEMALAGIRQMISFDEMLDTMYHVGKRIPYELRETALGGCATTPSGCKFCHS